MKYSNTSLFRPNNKFSGYNQVTKTGLMLLILNAVSLETALCLETSRQIE